MRRSQRIIPPPSLPIRFKALFFNDDDDDDNADNADSSIVVTATADEIPIGNNVIRNHDAGYDHNDDVDAHHSSSSRSSRSSNSNSSSSSSIRNHDHFNNDDSCMSIDMRMYKAINMNLSNNSNNSSKFTNKCNLIHRNPNIYLIKDFLSSYEIDHLDNIITSKLNSFQLSFTDNDNLSKLKIISTNRTSEYIYLSKMFDKTIRNIEYRVSDYVGLSSQYVEPLQIVSYKNGQQFDVHHDIGTLNIDDNSIDVVYPKRLVTFFIYLNNLPYGYGHTEFPKLGLSVQPMKGAALLFSKIIIIIVIVVGAAAAVVVVIEYL